MEPAISIIAYLWDSRNTWLKHHPECVCSFEERVEDFLNQIHFGTYMEVVVTADGPQAVWLHKTADEWSEEIGQKAHDRQLNKLIEYHSNVAATLMSIQATETRLMSDD